MGRIYTVAIDGVTVTAAGGDADLVELAPAAQKPIRIVGWNIDVTSELGDAAEEQIRYKWIRGHATSGNGSSVTPQPIESSSNTAAGFAAETNGATIASTGTAKDMYSGGFNERAGERMFLPEKMQFGASLTDVLLVLRMMNTLADDVTLSGTVWVEELG